jgi:hypothetical protein
MKIRIQVVVDLENGQPGEVEEIAQLERGALQPEELGMTFAEAKTLLHGMQQTMVDKQVEQYLAQHVACPHCGRRRSKKGEHHIVFHTLFGKLKLTSPRLYQCCYRSSEPHSVSPLSDLLVTHTAPELLYLETKFASLMSYGLSVKLLAEVLPIGEEINPTSVRRNLHRVAEWIESELGDEKNQFIEGCPNDWAKQPPPGAPLIVGLDGGYVG